MAQCPFLSDNNNVQIFSSDDNWTKDYVSKTVIEINLNLTYQKQSPKLDWSYQPGHIAQLVTCLTADPGVASSFTARSHTFAEIDHEIISSPFR